MDEGKIVYSSELSDKGFAEGAARIRSHIHNLSSQVGQEGNKIDSVFDNIGRRMEQAFAVGSIVAFQKKIIDVRGEMEKLQISFKTLAGEQVGKQLYEDIKQFATTTPMMMKDLAQGAQTLLGFNIAAEKVMPILRQLGDISMGDAQKFNSLTLAFAQASATGKLLTQDQKQMVNAGFNPLQYMAEKTGKSLKELTDMMSKGEITIEMMEDAFRSATSEGGKFYGMLDKQSKGMAGAVSNLQGAWEDMLNDIGEKQQGFLVSGTQLATKLVQNYETIGKILLQLVATYGSYKAAVIAVSLAEDMYNGKIVLKTRLLRAAAVAQEWLNKAMLNNPAVLVAAGVMTLISALVIFKSRTEEAAEAQKKLDEAFENTQAQIHSERANIDRLFQKLRDAKKGTEEYKQVKDQILGQYGKYLNGLSNEVRSLKNVEEAYRAVARAARDAALARGREAALREVQDTYGKNYSKNISDLQSFLKNRQGGEAILGEIQKELRKSGTISKETERKLIGMTGQQAYRGTMLPVLLKNLQDNEKYLKDYTNLVDKRFKVEEEETKKEQAKVERNKSVIEEEKKQLQAKLDNLTKEKAIGQEGIDLKKKIQALDKELEAYDASGKKGEKAAKDASKRNAESIQQELAYQDELLQIRKDGIRLRAEAAIAGIIDDAERERAERENQHKATIQQIESQEDDIYRSIYEQRKKSYELTNKDKKYENTEAGALGWQGVSGTLSKEEKKYYNERSKVIKAELDKENAQYSRYVRQRYMDEAQAMNDFLKEYGSIEQQRYAITKEYDQKISKEQNVWRKKSLEAQKKSALAQLDARKLAENIDWSHAFEGIGNVLKDLAEETLKQVEDYMKTADFKGLTADAKKSYVDLRQQLMDAGGQRASNPFSSKTWDEIAALTKKYQVSVKNLKASVDKEKEIREKLVKAEQRLALDPTNVGLQAVVATYRKQLEDAGQATQEYSDEVTENRNDLDNKTNAAAQGLKNFNSILGDLTSGTLSGFVNGVSNVIASLTKNTSDDMEGLVGLIGEKAGGIIGAILSIVDMLGDKPVEFFDNLFDGLSRCIEAIIAHIPEIIASAVKGVGNIVGSVFTGLGDLLAGIFGGGEDWSAYEAALDKWGGILDSWEENVRYERELMEKKYGAQAIEASQKALEAAQKAADAAQGIYKGWADSGAGLFSHSNGHNVNEGVKWGLLYDYDKDLFNKVGQLHTWNFFDKQFVTASGDVSKLFELTWQQLEQLKNRAPQFWASIHGEAQNYLDQYIEAGKAAEETLKALNEQLTTTTSENVFSDFLESLYDLADGVDNVTESIAENWQKMVNRMVINNIIAKDFQDDLDGWYKRLADLQSRLANGLIDNSQYQTELSTLMDDYNSYFDQAQQKMNEFVDMGIIKPIEKAAEEVAGIASDMAGSVKSAFSDLMGDPTQDVEEWGRNLRNSLIRQFVQAQLLGSEFEEWAKGIAERYNSAWEAYKGGGINEADLRGIMTNIGSEVDAYTETLSEKAKRLMEAFGYTPDTEEAQSAFSGLRDTFLDTLTDIEGDAKSFRKKLQEIMVRDFMEKQVLDVEFTINGMTFENFEAYSVDWNKRYQQAMSEGNMELVNSLLEELVKAREITLENANEIRDTLQEVVGDTTFSDMGSSFVSTLTDMSKSADDWAQEVGSKMAEKLIQEMVVKSAVQPLFDNIQQAFNAAMGAEGANATSVIGAILPQLEQLKAAYPELHELSKGIMEALGLDTLTATGFNDLRSTFISTLTDMESDAADFGEDIARTMLEQMIDEYVKSEYQDRLDDINRRWREALESGNVDAIEGIRKELLLLYDTMNNDEALKKLTEDLKALAGTETPFDGLRDQFRSALMDMSKSAKDFTQELNQMIAEDFVDEFVMGDAFDEKLAEWKKRYQSITKDGNLTEEQRLAQLKQLSALISSERDALTEQTRDIINMLGLGQHEDQQATMNMAEAATYDQFELYLGLATSHLMVAEQTKGLVEQVVSSMQAMGAATSPASNYGQQIFMRLGTTNEYLLATKRLVGVISEKIDLLNSHLSKL